MRTSSSKDSNMETTRFLGTISASSIRKLLPRSLSSSSTKHKTNKNPNFNSENDPPIDPNIQIDLGQTTPVVPELKPSDVLSPKHEIARSEVEKQASVPSDPPVKVVVRIKPANDGERDGDRTVKKVSSDTVSVGDRRFTFDSVFDSKANQEDVFQLVGIPLVKNALAGYNTSIVSYGQSGSGKTYTMWGPPSAMVEDPSPRSHQGIVPRTFQMLFSEIDKERENSEGKQINYQFRCSFLEIYNEQIGDLLDPTQRNLEIKDDPKNGLCVENLTEEYVTSYEDVMQILIKGLSSRKVGATSVNSKSSRSHIVFTFVIESWCKGTSSKCFGSSKTSRISLVDLAGLDRNKVDDEGRQSAREGKSVKKSLSRLGHLVNSLATKGPLSGKHEDSLYRDSCLTHLLRESLGGNSKLTVICAISPDKNNDSEILRTLRFGERMKSVRNDPVVNEITEDDVNDLSDQIRQLKEELIRAKSSASSNSVGSNYGHFRGRNVRESLNQLRVSLNRSLILPRIDIDSDEEVNVDEHDVNELRKQLDELHNFHEEISGDLSLDRSSIQLGENCETDLMSEDDTNCPEETESEVINPQTYQDELPLMENIALTHKLGGSPKTSGAKNPEFRSSISISSCCRPQILQEPTMSESPKIGKNQRKSVAISSSHLVNRNNVSESSKLNSEVLRQSLSQSEHIRSSLQSNKIFPGPTESLAASLQRGLQIIDCHQRNSASNKPSVTFSFEHLTLKPCPEVDNTSASGTLLCASCRRRIQEKDSSDVQDSLKTWIVAMDEAGNPMTEEATKDAKNSMAAVTKREELENRCKEQEAKIEQLNQLIEQYNRNSSVENGQESSSHCLLSSKHEIIPFEEPKDQDIHVLKDENKLLRCNSLDNHHPEMIKENYEIKEVQNESTLEYGNTIFEVNEKETLLKEIQFLRRKLQLQNDGSPNKSTEKLRSSLLSRSIQLRKSFAAHQNFNEEELERERQRWTEMESDWISLTDELRIDLDAHRRRAEKVEMELKLEKQCTEELDDALHRAVLSHARFVEHYAELQEKYNDLVGKHRAIMEGIAEVKRAATKAGKKGRGPRFAKSLAAELSAMRVERERERELLKKENKSLRIQLRDTAEAVHAAGELLVRLREAEHAASVAEENFANMQQDNEKLKKQMEKLKRKHKMEMVTMKQYLAESKLPESALQPLYQDDSDMAHHTTIPGDDQAWRAEFGAIYQDHY